MPMMTPPVAAPVTPQGCPSAITHWPGRTIRESASWIVGRSFPWILKAARSSSRSVVRISAPNACPSASSTMSGPLSATCAFVTINPSGCQIVPAPVPRLPLRTCTRPASAVSMTLVVSELISTIGSYIRILPLDRSRQGRLLACFLRRSLLLPDQNVDFGQLAAAEETH